MKHKLDLSSWNRKTHFDFFSKFDEPFFGITVNIDCTKAYEKAKQNKISFFIYYLHKTLLTINAIENFRYRIIDNEVFIYDTINASATIMRDDTTFGFSLIDHFEDLDVFSEKAKLEIERVRTADGLITRDFSGHYNLIHFSSLPWVNFTSISHSRSFSYPDSCPKISFGKMIEENGKRSMAISVHVHHALIDGYHVGLFVEELQKQMDS